MKKILLTAVNAKYIHSNLAVYSLRAYARELKENIVLNKLCTYEGEFHSYRRDREKSGRNGALIYFYKNY